MPPLSGSWANALKGEFSKDYYKKLFQTVGAEYKTHTIYPPADDIFNAFHFTPLEQVKVVILGAGTGARTLLFRKTGSRHSAVSGQYLQGTRR